MDLVWEEAKVGLGECKCIYDWAIGGVRLIHKFDFDLTCVMEVARHISFFVTIDVADKKFAKSNRC